MPVTSSIKAVLTPVEADVSTKLLFKSGFYSQHVSLCMSILEPCLCAERVS